MSKARWFVALLGTAAIVAAGCTGGERGDSLVRSSSGANDVIAAIDALRTGSGRFRLEWRAQGGDEIDAFSVVAEGEFSGSDLRVSTTAGAEAEDSPPLTSTVMRVGDRQFVSLDQHRTMIDQLRASLEELHAENPSPFAPPVDDLFGELPDGADWVEVTGGDGGFVGPWGGTEPVWDPLDALSRVEDVVEAGEGEVGGVATRRFTATIATDSFLEASGQPDVADVVDEMYASMIEGADEALAEELATQMEQLRALSAYASERLVVEVEVHLDGEDRLVRSIISSRVDVEDQYAECSFFRNAAQEVVVDVSGHGEEITIEVPDPATILSEEEYEELTGFSTEPVEDDLGFDPEELEREFERLETVLSTADGERTRGAIEDDLRKFGSVIELDPEAVADLDDAALVEAHDRASAALAGMGRTPTALGELTRVELLWNVRWGMELLGIDPATADGMSDQQLAELIDAHVEQYGVAGDGAWGDPAVEDPFGGVPGDLGTEGGDADLADAFGSFVGDVANCPTA